MNWGEHWENAMPKPMGSRQMYVRMCICMLYSNIYIRCCRIRGWHSHHHHPHHQWAHMVAQTWTIYPIHTIPYTIRVFECEHRLCAHFFLASSSLFFFFFFWSCCCYPFHCWKREETRGSQYYLISSIAIRLAFNAAVDPKRLNRIKTRCLLSLSRNDVRNEPKCIHIRLT